MAGSRNSGRASGEVQATTNEDVEKNVNKDQGEASAALDSGDSGAIHEVFPSALGNQLKAAYSELIRQPVPDKFLQLLDRLEKQGHSTQTSEAHTDGAGEKESGS